MSLSQDKCLNCGWKITRDIEKCPKCGTAIEVESSEEFAILEELAPTVEKELPKASPIDVEIEIDFSQTEDEQAEEEAPSKKVDEAIEKAAQTNHLVTNRLGQRLKLIFIFVILIALGYYAVTKFQASKQQKTVEKPKTTEQTPSNKTNTKKNKRTRYKKKSSQKNTLKETVVTDTVPSPPLDTIQKETSKPVAKPVGSQKAHLQAKIKELEKKLRILESSDVSRIKKRRRRRDLQEEIDGLKGKVKNL